jgi:hypothetical protein
MPAWTLVHLFQRRQTVVIVGERGEFEHGRPAESARTAPRGSGSPIIARHVVGVSRIPRRRPSAAAEPVTLSARPNLAELVRDHDDRDFLARGHARSRPVSPAGREEHRGRLSDEQTLVEGPTGISSFCFSPAASVDTGVERHAERHALGSLQRAHLLLQSITAGASARR